DLIKIGECFSFYYIAESLGIHEKDLESVGHSVRQILDRYGVDHQLIDNFCVIHTKFGGKSEQFTQIKKLIESILINNNSMSDSFFKDLQPPSNNMLEELQIELSILTAEK